MELWNINFLIHLEHNYSYTTQDKIVFLKGHVKMCCHFSPDLCLTCCSCRGIVSQPPSAPSLSHHHDSWISP